MRGARQVISLALLAVLAVACDTTQPLQLDEQTFALGMRGLGATIPVYNVYDMFRDNDNNDVADDVDGDGNPDFWLWCLDANVTVTPNSVPYGFTVEVTILRAGEDQRELVTSPDALADETLNVTQYDTTIPNVPGIPPDQPPITVGSDVYKFTNTRRLSAANETVAAATSNPVSDVDGGHGIGNGLCSLAFYGPARFDTLNGPVYPLTFVLHKGDTVTVKAIRASGPFQNGAPIIGSANVALVASLTTGGRPVNVTGSFVTDPATGPNAGMAFTFRSF
jgi:hypothetical protein